MKPTPEQAAIVDAFKARKPLVIKARAGTGKTSTLRLCGEAAEGRGIYIAYNRAIADDGAASFPPNVKCATAHSLAYGSVGKLYRDRLNGKRLPARELAPLLGIASRFNVPGNDGKPHTLTEVQQARIVMSATAKFCYSAASSPEPWMVEPPAGVDNPAATKALRDHLAPFVEKAWADIVDTGGRLPFSHDCYLKIWALSGPRLSCDFVMLDEAQDANPLIAQIFEHQKHAQRVLVGDDCQAIYGWRGAVDAMAKFEGEQLYLAQSFRFGQAIADEANKWCDLLGARPLLRGFEKVHSRLDKLDRPDAVLCRSNAGAIATLMWAVKGGRAALVGGDKGIRALAQASVTLMAGAGTDHPELMAFKTWTEVQEYVENEEAGSDLKVFVKLIDRHGPDVVMGILDRLVEEKRAQVIVSTAHKSKGREWSTVRVHEDFHEPGEKHQEIPRADAMLAYVTVTRAKQVLDRGGLAWVDKWTSGKPRRAGAA